MKDFSLFLLKNSLAAKMKKGFRNFCNGVGSTSTLNQGKMDQNISCVAAPSLPGSPLTLEEMILHLDLEEAAARRSKLEEYGEVHQRMSCVNNSDILRSARNAAMNQYPRFSLDGRDAMYRSSFRNNFAAGRRSVCCAARGRFSVDGYEVDMEKNLGFPSTLAGENVVWCKPGVVAKLMGLDALPVPVSGRHGRRRVYPHHVLSRKQNLRRMGRNELHKERFMMGLNRCRDERRNCEGPGFCAASHRSVTKPVSHERQENWRFGRAR